MPTESNTNRDATQAPFQASWQTSYLTQAGFVCHIALQGNDIQDLMAKAAILLSALLEQGSVPDKDNRRFHSRGHHSKEEKHYCFIHLCSMQRFEKGGRTWFSHRLDNGEWCRGPEQ